MKQILCCLLLFGTISASADLIDRSGDYYCRPNDVMYNQTITEPMLKISVRKDYSVAEVYEPASNSPTNDPDYNKMTFKQLPTYILRKGSGSDGLSFKLNLPNNFGGNTYRSFTLAGAIQSDGHPEVYETLVSKEGVFSVVSVSTPSEEKVFYAFLCIKP